MSKVKVTIASSEIENPCDMDYQWKVYSFSSRHINFRDPIQENWFDQGQNCIDPDLQEKLENGLAFRLGYYEHGNCVWFLQGEGKPGTECPFDGVHFAGLIVWEHEPEGMGAKTHEERAKDARNFLELYTAWCNGEGYGYSVDELDEDGEEIDCVDSCWGFNGADTKYMFECIREATKGHEVAEICGESRWLAEYHDV